ncbi:DNA mismatch repair protein [Arachidicoccus ginsenosidimutans]|nr:DNA mismatch repair protein [Arachidicoccus sp. BS20]
MQNVSLNNLLLVFITDKQTIDDLGIFSHRNGSSIYELYNRTHTRGGEAVLKEMFENPLSDKGEINRRAGIIAYFSGQSLSFPFNASLFDTTEKYLADKDEQANTAAHRSVLGEKEIQQGVTATIQLIQGIKIFIEQNDIAGVAGYAKERDMIKTLVEDADFLPVLKENPKSKPSYAAIAAYDTLFREQQYKKINRLLRHIYYLDVYLSIAALAKERKFVFPKALEKGQCILRLEGVYHPELKNPVANSIDMSADSNVVFLTGANMAGKSTFLRSVSTAVYVAHIGFPVAAKAMEFSVLDGIYTTINLPDNLGIGASHFYNEVLRVKKVAMELNQGKSLFVVFDELFRGTNVKDAQEGTVAVTGAFAGKKNSLFIISSHIVEAGEELKKQPSVFFRYLPTRMNGHVPEYTYTLEKGITDDRHGMLIIRNEGILETLKNGKKKRVAE